MGVCQDPMVSGQVAGIVLSATRRRVIAARRAALLCLRVVSLPGCGGGGGEGGGQRSGTGGGDAIQVSLRWLQTAAAHCGASAVARFQLSRTSMFSGRGEWGAHECGCGHAVMHALKLCCWDLGILASFLWPFRCLGHSS